MECTQGYLKLMVFIYAQNVIAGHAPLLFVLHTLHACPSQQATMQGLKLSLPPLSPLPLLLPLILISF